MLSVMHAVMIDSKAFATLCGAATFQDIFCFLSPGNNFILLYIQTEGTIKDSFRCVLQSNRVAKQFKSVLTAVSAASDFK